MYLLFLNKFNLLNLIFNLIFNNNNNVYKNINENINKNIKLLYFINLTFNINKYKFDL